MHRQILIVEQQGSLSAQLAPSLEHEGLGYRSASTAASTLAQLQEHSFDAILIDDSVAAHELTEQISYAAASTPLILLSSQATLENKIRALYAGADDYIAKPFHIAELFARLHALLRRATTAQNLTEYHFGDVQVNFITGMASKNGKPLNLSVKELRLLRFLITRRSSVVSREELLHHVWGSSSPTTRTIDVHVAGVRRKIEDEPQRPQFILTYRGKGYIFQDAKCKELLTEPHETVPATPHVP